MATNVPQAAPFTTYGWSQPNLNVLAPRSEAITGSYVPTGAAPQSILSRPPAPPQTTVPSMNHTQRSFICGPNSWSNFAR